jgi:cation diffusion facilitator CzcD-associated flavoprotein CzcO
MSDPVTASTKGVQPGHGRRMITSAKLEGGVGGNLPDLDLVVVGAGFSGLYMLHRARGLGLTTRVFETGSGVGGTWYWNRYPGARCDVESLEYSYQFSEELQQEWVWTERYAGQPEILRYLEHAADRFDLRRDIQFDTRVVSAHFDETNSAWSVRTDDGSETTSRFLVMATGCLSSANVPEFPGLSSFRGRVLHTGVWPHEPVDLSGLRVGVIGTGSSGVQSIPVIAAQALRLTVFQRTATYSVPAHNHPLDDEEQQAVKADYAGFRERNSQMIFALGSRTPLSERLALETEPEERDKVFEERWHQGGLPFLGSFMDLLLDPTANETAAEFVRSKIRGTVRDPRVAELLSPRTVIGCKRLCVDSGYYETFNRDNVELVDVSGTPIEEITPSGVRVGGREYELDCIVLATGFDAMTGALSRVDIRGREGTSLRDAWSEGPRTYLGLAVSGFPNMFTITGPGSPSVLTNMIVSIEHHVNWVSDCIEHLNRSGYASIEATCESQDAWVEHVNAIAGFTLFPTCNSWYLGANVPGKPRVFMPLVGFPPYVERCAEVAANGYEGFTKTPAPVL